MGSGPGRRVRPVPRKDDSCREDAEREKQENHADEERGDPEQSRPVPTASGIQKRRIDENHPAGSAPGEIEIRRIAAVGTEHRSPLAGAAAIVAKDKSQFSGAREAAKRRWHSGRAK